MTMAGITTRGQTDNVTVEGIHFTNCVCILSGATNVTVRYNTFQHFSTFAVRLCSVCGSTNAPINNIKVLYNQIDHVFYCFAAGGHGGGWTFSHNVCGPGIGEGGDPDAHYVQVIGNDNVTVDNNAFEGPFDVHALAAGAHNNVSHQDGSNLEFDNNIVWHADSRAQTVLWGDDGPVRNTRANNNLFVEDPNDRNCNGSGNDCPTVAIWLDNAFGSNQTVSNNTVAANAGNSSGGIFTRPGITRLVVQNNIAVGSPGANFSLAGCFLCSGNVADDNSGDIRWRPTWQNTRWPGTNVRNGPNDGSPWVPPPVNYYRPTGLASTAGYQRSIGP